MINGETVMLATNQTDTLQKLQSTPASSIKGSWRDVVKFVLKSGRLLVTNHKEPEVVILSLEAYAELTRAAGEGDATRQVALDELSKRFDARLASLDNANAGKQLRAMMSKPTKLNGKLKSGASY
jgi:PHD/YefM family antitoxin component YafN of YafNO toxin-antitoxin module